MAHQERSVVQQLFNSPKVAIGVVHCAPLPGSPHFDGSPFEVILDRAMRDAAAYIEGGLDSVMIENHGDIPFIKPEFMGPETSAAMAVITDTVRRRFDVPVGVNVLANAPMHALAVAKAGGATYIRVNQWANAYVANEGIIEGEAGRVLRYRASIGAKDIKIFADVHVKHGAHAIVADRSIGELARDVEFFDADVAIATGHRTGNAAELSEVKAIAAGAALPVMIGSGVTGENVAALLEVADGVIIGSSLKRDGVWTEPVDLERVRQFARVMGGIKLRASAA